MTFANRNKQLIDDREFQQLKGTSTDIENRSTRYMNRIATLLSATTDTTEKAEISSMRDTFKSNMRTVLGV